MEGISPPVSFEQILRVKTQMVFDKGSNKVVAMIVAGLNSQGQRPRL